MKKENDIISQEDELIADFLSYKRTIPWIDQFKEALSTNRNSTIENTELFLYLNKVLNESLDLINMVNKGEKFYRARKVEYKKFLDENNGLNIDTWSGFDKYESKEPPLGVSSAGRNNIYGVSYLYLASNPYTACAEIKPSIESVISLAEFELLEDIKIINISDFAIIKEMEHIQNASYKAAEKMAILKHTIRLIMNEYSTYCDETDSLNYKVCQYISEFFRKSGFDGVKYASSRGDQYNLTLFKCAEKFVRFNNSRLIYNAQTKYNFVDLQNEKIISTKDSEITVCKIKDRIKYNIH